MLTSFFSTTKPSNFIFTMIYMLVFLLITRFEFLLPFDFMNVMSELAVFGLFILSFLTFNFIAHKNVLTDRNAYKLLFLVSFTCLLLPALENANIIIANFFVLLALRRIISLKTQQDAIKKIFDATFLICLSSVFYFWAILFLFLVYCGIFMHLRMFGKLYLVPLVAILAAFSIATLVDLISTNTFYTFAQWWMPSNFDFSAYSNPAIFIPVSIILALTIWSLLFYLVLIRKTGGHNKSSLSLVLLCLINALAVAVMGETKDSGELLFYVAPLAIVVTNYVQSLKDKWFQESLMLFAILAPVLLLIYFQ